MITDHSWLVKRRSKIQKFLLDLYNFGEQDKINSINRSLFLDLVGISYSLWRAVFITDVNRKWSSTIEKAKDFLKRLIEDNAIAYQQEKENRDWTIGYYLNNAYFRIKSSLKKKNNGWKINKKDKENLKSFKKLWKKRNEELEKEDNPQDVWDTAYKVAEYMFENLQRMSQIKLKK